MHTPSVRKRRVVFKADEYIAVEAVELLLGHNKKKTIHSVIYPEVTAVLPLLDKETAVLAKEHRPTVHKTFFSIPGGKAAERESLTTSARRELQEEVGYTCTNIKKLVSYYPLVGLTTCRVHIFVATGLKKTRQHLDVDETITPVIIKLRDIAQLIASGKIMDSKTIIGFAMLRTIKR